jgi:allantoin racemase
MRKILAILPFVVQERTLSSHEAFLRRDAGHRGSDIRAVALQSGPTPDQFQGEGFRHAIEETVDVVEKAQGDFDGIMISCFEDPALAESRQASTLPVVGPCETAMALTRLSSRPFFIVSPDPGSEPHYRRIAAEWGLAERFSSYECVEVDIEGASLDEAGVVAKVTKAIESGRRKANGAIAILGCTAFGEYAAAIRSRAGGMVIEPATESIRMLEALIDLGPRERGARRPT